MPIIGSITVTDSYVVTIRLYRKSYMVVVAVWGMRRGAIAPLDFTLRDLQSEVKSRLQTFGSVISHRGA